MLIALLNTLTGIKIHQSEYSETDTWLNVYIYQLNVTVIIYFGVYFILLNRIKWTREFHHHHHHDYSSSVARNSHNVNPCGRKVLEWRPQKGKTQRFQGSHYTLTKIDIPCNKHCLYNVFCFKFGQYNHTYRYHNTNIFNELYLLR